MNRPQIVIALLLLFFLLSTSAGFANISAIQEQLRTIQLKLIKERLKLIQEQVLKVNVPPPVAPSPAVEPVQSAEELMKNLERQKTLLEQAVASLRPKAITDETNRIEKRLMEINEELKEATGTRLVELQKELTVLIGDQEKLQREVRELLEESLKAHQAALLKDQITRLEEKIRLLPRPVVKAPEAAVAETPQSVQLKVIREQIEKAQLKLLQLQVKAITEKVQTIRR